MQTEIGKAPLRYGLTALVLGNIFLAFGPWFVRMADTGPVSAAFWRVALAAPILILIARIMGDPMRKSHFPWLALFFISGLFFAADLTSWHYGITMTKLANSNLLGNSTSLFLPLWAFIASRQWPGPMQAAALLLAVVGAGLMMGRSFELSSSNLTGDMLCILAGALYTGYLVLMSRARGSIGPWPTLAWSTLMCIAPLGFIALALDENIVPHDWTPLLALALSSQILGQCLMIYVINGLSPVLIGISLLIQPLIGAVIGWFAYNEALSSADWIGGGLIALAIILVSKSDTQKV